MGCLSCTIQSFVSLVAWLHSILQPCKANELLWMSLRQWLWAGHFMRQAFDSEIWKRHQSAYSTTELARSVHYSQLILQLSWMQLSTVMVSSWVHPHIAITKRVITCGVQTSLSETKNFQVSLFFRPVAFYPNITVHPLLPALKSYRCWNSVLEVLFARAWPWSHPVSCSSSIMAALRSADSTAMEQHKGILTL